MDNLAHLIRCLRTAKDNPDDLNHITDMLSAISRYLGTLEEVRVEDLIVPIVRLAGDMHDVISGHTPPHLMTTGYRGTTSHREMAQGNVVGTVDVLAKLDREMEAEANLGDVYDEVSRVCNAAGLSNGAEEKAITGKLIKSWRRKLREDPERYIFMKNGRDMIVNFRIPEELSSEKRRDFVIDGLKVLLKHS